MCRRILLIHIFKEQAIGGIVCGVPLLISNQRLGYHNLRRIDLLELESITLENLTLLVLKEHPIGIVTILVAKLVPGIIVAPVECGKMLPQVRVYDIIVIHEIHEAVLDDAEGMVALRMSDATRVRALEFNNLRMVGILAAIGTIACGVIDNIPPMDYIEIDRVENGI